MYGSSECAGQAQSLGFLMIGIEGHQLSAADRQRLMHPAIAGVILFSRNYQDPVQLAALCESIHCLRKPRLLISVDHEGGRVQRFKKAGFTHLAAMGNLGKRYDQSPATTLSLAKDMGWLLAAELLACGVDFSFTPVVDLDYGQSDVIGDRAFHHNPQLVARLAEQLIEGMRAAGMSGVAKHFPGHGYAVADTHFTMAEDERSLTQLMSSDIQPYTHLVQHHCAAVMAAHVVYPQVDSLPAGMSVVWMQQVLRQQLGFNGCIVSDDIGMKAVAEMGDGGQLSELFRQAGCDLVLICNETQQIDEALAFYSHYDADAVQESRLIRLHGRPQQAAGLAKLHMSKAWLDCYKRLEAAQLIVAQP